MFDDLRRGFTKDIQGLTEFEKSKIAQKNHQNLSIFAFLPFRPPKWDPFNLSNIVAGNVSNQSFGKKKTGAGNLAIILTPSLSICRKKRSYEAGNLAKNKT